MICAELIAYTRAVTSGLLDLNSSHVQREPLDSHRAVIEPETYEERLANWAPS